MGIILQNLNKTLKIQINIFLIISYFLIFLLDFKIEQIIFKSCVRGSCYQDYLFKNKEEDLKVNLLGKHFIKNQTFLPLSTYANDRILGSNENGYWPIFTSDRYGFNNKDDIYKLENFKNIIIGDSFAQNATVNYEKSIQGILNQKNFSTLSFGVGGNGPLLNLANFKEYTVNLNYQNLIYFFTEKNDLFYDLKLEKKNKILINYLNLEFTQKLINKRDKIDTLLDNKTNKIFNEYIKNKKLSLKKVLRTLTLPNTRFILNIINSGEEDDYNLINKQENFKYKEKDIKEDSIESNLRIQNEVFKQIKNISIGSNFYLLYIPNKKDFLRDKKNKLFYEIEKIAKENNFKVIDLYKEVDLNMRSKLFPYKYQHFNEFGQNKIADIIVKNIKN